MSRRRKIQAGLVAALLAIAFGIYLLRSQDPDPEYRGLKVSKWIETAATSTNKDSLFAMTVLQEMDDRALPQFIAHLDMRYTGRRERFHQWAWEKSPALVRGWMSAPPYIYNEQAAVLLALQQRDSFRHRVSLVPTILRLMDDVAPRVKPGTNSNVRTFGILLENWNGKFYSRPQSAGPADIMHLCDWELFRECLQNKDALLDALATMKTIQPEVQAEIVHRWPRVNIGGRHAGECLTEIKAAYADVVTRPFASVLLCNTLREQPDVLPEVIRILETDDPELAPRAAEALGLMKEQFDVAVPALTRALANHDANPSPRPVDTRSEPARPTWQHGGYFRYAASALAGISKHTPLVEESMLPLLNDPNPRLRAGALATLKLIDAAGPALMPRMRELAEDQDAIVRYLAADALYEITSETEWNVRKKIMELSDADDRIRWNAVDALERFGRDNPAAVDALVKALREDRDVRIRGLCARALGVLGARSAVPALHAALKDDAEYVRGEAQSALRVLEAEVGEPFGQ